MKFSVLISVPFLLQVKFSVLISVQFLSQVKCSVLISVLFLSELKCSVLISVLFLSLICHAKNAFYIFIQQIYSLIFLDFFWFGVFARCEFTDDVSETAVGPIFTGHE